jgi:hypothetical protein
MYLKWLTPMDEDEFNVFWRSILPFNDIANSMRNYLRLSERTLREAVARHEDSAEIPYSEADPSSSPDGTAPSLNARLWLP